MLLKLTLSVGNEPGSLRRRWRYPGEGRLERFERKLDAPTATARLVGRENQFGSPERAARRQLRLAASLERIDHIQHAKSHELAKALARVGCNLDVAPVGIPFPPDAYQWRTDGHFDHPIAADEPVALWALDPVAGQQQTPHPVLVGEEADPLALDGDAEDRRAATPIDLADRPLDRGFVVIEAEHIEPVRTPVEEVIARAFQPLQLPARGCTEDVASLAAWCYDT